MPLGARAASALGGWVEARRRGCGRRCQRGLAECRAPDASCRIRAALGGSCPGLHCASWRHQAAPLVGTCRGAHRATFHRHAALCVLPVRPHRPPLFFAYGAACGLLAWLRGRLRVRADPRLLEPYHQPVPQGQRDAAPRRRRAWHEGDHEHELLCAQDAADAISLRRQRSRRRSRSQRQRRRRPLVQHGGVHAARDARAGHSAHRRPLRQPGELGRRRERRQPIRPVRGAQALRRGRAQQDVRRRRAATLA
mmetsp:Transcript_53075/g.119093  ORF Transcript_53075/g.119093 Transcript_53075/m.119093 type:complete len:252 (-) Transcript_53075:248-1003(-)